MRRLLKIESNDTHSFVVGEKAQVTSPILSKALMMFFQKVTADYFFTEAPQTLLLYKALPP